MLAGVVLKHTDWRPQAGCFSVPGRLKLLIVTVCVARLRCWMYRYYCI